MTEAPLRGALVLVGTPIGNLGDLTPRAIEALARADLVCCEDTRRTGRLLSHAGVRAARLLTVNDHTEVGAIAEVVGRIAAGEQVAVVTDAGMPGVSDPGERLVEAVTAEGYEVVVVPGPSAVVSALVVSGLPAGRFVFEGFLPRKGAGRSRRLAALVDEDRTMVLYEAPHRLARTLADLVGVCGGERRVALARELTKLHEEVWRGSLDGACRWVVDQPPRGEFVVVLDGAPEPSEADDAAVSEAAERALARGLSTRDAALDVARALGVARRRAYAATLAAAAAAGDGAFPGDGAPAADGEAEAGREQ